MHRKAHKSKTKWCHKNVMRFKLNLELIGLKQNKVINPYLMVINIKIQVFQFKLANVLINESINK